MPRTRELMRVFKDVGLVEQLGSGMSRILKVYDKDIFEISEHFIKVTFPFFKEENSIFCNGDENGNENGDENKVISILRERPEITANALSQELGCSTRKISRIIKKLREGGKIKRVGSDRKGYWEIRRVKSFFWCKFFSCHKS